MPKTKNYENKLLNSYVRKFKKGDKKYIQQIYKICLSKIIKISRSISYVNLSCDEDDFIQEAIIHLLYRLIKAYKLNKKTGFSRFFEVGIHNFKVDFLKKYRRRNLLFDVVLEDDKSLFIFLFGKKERLHHGWFYSDESIPVRIIISEYLNRLYKISDNKEKILLKELCENRYENNKMETKKKIAKEMGIGYRRFMYILKNLENKFCQLTKK